MKSTVTIVLVLLAAALTACYGDDDPTLQLPGGDITENELRELWRDQLAQAPGAGAVICNAIVGASAADILDFFELSTPAADETTATDRDIKRAAEIIEEECADSFANA